MERPLALVVDGEPESRRRLAGLLSEAGLEPIEAEGTAAALDGLRTRHVNVLVVDARMADLGTWDFLHRARRARPSAVVLLVVSQADPDVVLRAVDEGAFDVLRRPVDAAAVRVAAGRALTQSQLREEVAELRERLRDRTGYRSLIGRSAVMERLRERLERHAESDLPVLLVGEEGCGKELAARTIHEMSPRRQAPFFSLDCAVVPAAAIESELFGGGTASGAGLLEKASGGSLLFDEVTLLPSQVQDRLAEALRTGGFRRDPEPQTIPLDLRVLSSSSRDVDADVAAGRLREDLHDELATNVVEVPALRERLEDVALLARHFIDAICEINELPAVQLSPEALQVLEGHDWPGNVRELRNAVEHAVILASEGTILPRHLPPAIQRGRVTEPGGEAAADRPFRDAKREVVDSFERTYLSDLLAKHGGNVTAAAQQAGMLRSALQRLLRKHDIRSVEFRRSGRERGTDRS